MKNCTLRVTDNEGTRPGQVAVAAKQFADYAVLCANAYSLPDAPLKHDDSLASWKMRATQIPTAPRWTRAHAVNEYIKGCKKINDLGVETWVGSTSGALQNEVVIVFRGTAVLWDWISNLRWFIGRRVPWLVTDKYAQVEEFFPELLKVIEAKYPRSEIVATGHSLGGGLAQFCGYSCDVIKRVYAFDSSPVTGYYSVALNERWRNKQHLEVFRIHQKGEPLAYARGPIKWLRHRLGRRPDRVPITEYRFGFDTRPAVVLIITFPIRVFKLHDICTLAWHLNHIDQSLGQALE